MPYNDHPYSSHRFRFAPNVEHPIFPAPLRRGPWVKHPAVAFTLGVLTTLIAKQYVGHASTIIDTYFMTCTSTSDQLLVDVTFASATTSMLTDATLASVPPRNLALFGGGARVNSLLTSATYDPRGSHPVGILRSGFRWARDTVLGVEFSRLHMSRPRDALSENMELGKCWEFQGAMGHIAIELLDVVAITATSVAHIPAPLLSQVAVGCAPRESYVPSLFTVNLRNPPGMLHTNRFVKLREFVFDVNSSSHHQFFSIDPGATTVKTSLVIFESSRASSAACGLTSFSITPLLPDARMSIHYVEDSLWSRIFSSDRSHSLADESFLLTHVALIGDPVSERSYVEVHYIDDSGDKCVCHFGALEAGKVYLPFFADNQYTIRISGSMDICFASIKLVMAHDGLASIGGPEQWPKYVGARELVDPTQTPPPSEDKGVTKEEDEARIMQSKVKHEHPQPTMSSPVQRLGTPIKLETTASSRTRTKLRTSEVKGESTEISSPGKTLSAHIKVETAEPSRIKLPTSNAKAKTECAETTSSSPVKMGVPIKLETPQPYRTQSKPPTSHSPTAIPEPANPKKRVIANADLIETLKRHKKEKVKEAHADAPKPEDKPEGTGLNEDGTYTFRRKTTVKIGDEAALFGLTSHLEGIRGKGMRELFIPSGVLNDKGNRSWRAWLLEVRASTKVNRAA
ncbi:hypothetical protein BDN71DRAFT_1513155 [Pleurotus eryngii]|uniref:SUN domain-containing protein n=1 Tax=Pleurotus eryngii TaxID=5323 RepID=A0A9P5ZHS4_PLEER|nr:hypothetical protein BDN71DRAFT_1513155 [Pleurotus eryngii]